MGVAFPSSHSTRRLLSLFSFKSVVITPLLKKQNSSDSDVNNMRAIATTPFLGKLFEKIIFNQTSEYLNLTSFFSSSQYGFRKGHSTEHLLIKITDLAFKAIDTDKILIVVALDLKKAFPSVSRKLLLMKLAEAGIDPTFFNNYLTNRTQRVRTRDGIFSDIIQNEWGVPEGSVNGPLFFSIFINKLPEQAQNVDTDLFADDTTLIMECFPQDIDYAIRCIEEDIMSIHAWLNDNLLELNHSKTEFMLIGSPCNLVKCGDVTLTVSDHTITLSERMRVLGFILDKHLIFDHHIAKLKKKLSTKPQSLISAASTAK